MRRFVALGPALVVLVTAALMLLVVPAAVHRVEAARTGARITLARAGLEEDDILERLNRAVRNVATSVEPSVVHIEVYGRDGSDPWMGSSGSGWVYDDHGHIVTNAHVVSGGRRIRVQLFDGQVLRGEVVGTDPFADVAVLRVPETAGLFPIRRASGERLMQGDRVYAFGSPFGFKFSMSEGIVSGLGRSARGPLGVAGVSNFIQTDAAVNPGNSGGPLVDIHGRLVGMNVAIATAHDTQGSATTEGQSAGISFAIPLGTIEARVGQILTEGRATPGYLGVRFTQVEDGRFIDAGGFRGRGFGIDMVVPGGPADKAGLKAGDAIVAINGETADDQRVLRTLISAGRPGQRVTVKVVRDGEVLELPVVLGEAPEALRTNQVATVLAEQLAVRLYEDRPMVERAPRGGAAYKAGLRAGQLIRKVGPTAVETNGDLAAALIAQGFLDGAEVTLTVQDPAQEGGETPAPKEVTIRLER